MNIIRMTGGLGNQMFSYALYLKFKSMGIDCMIDDFSEYEGHDNRRPLFLQDAFGIEYPRVSVDIYEEFTDSSMRFHKRLARKLRGRKSREYHEAGANYDPLVLKKDNAYLTGYFQSDKYFADVKEEIFGTFTFTDKVEKEADRILTKSVQTARLEQTPADASNNKNLVSIHVRRGDYLEVSEVYGGICTDEYYRSGIKMIMDKVPDPVFLIFSNDDEWTENWAATLFGTLDTAGHSDGPGYHHYNYHVISETEESNGYIDMCIMSRCSHNIIANSSFSWWGAYLNKNPEKIVIAPQKWNNMTDQTDIYTDDMIRI